MFLSNTSFFQSKHVGVAITGNALRVVEVDTAGNIIASAEAFFDQPLIVGGEINAATLQIALIQVLKQAKFSANIAAVCIPEKYAFSREYLLPQVKPNEVDEAIKWQVEKIFPFSANEIYTDWKFIGQEKSGTRIFIVAVPKSILDKLKSVFEAAGILPISFEPSALAITRLIDTQKNQKLIVVELDSVGSTSTLVINGNPAITTTTSFNSQSQPQEVLQELAGSIANLIKQLQSKGHDTQGLVINLAGEKSSTQMAQVLQQQLNLPVATLGLNNIKPEQQLAYVAAKTRIAAPTSDKTINLLPPILQQHYQAKSEHEIAKVGFKLSLALIIPAVVISLLGLLFTQMKLNNIQRSLANANQSQAIPTSTEPNKTLNVPEINLLVQRINKLFPEKVTPEQPITVVLNQIPENIVITNLSYEKGKKIVTLVGRANTREDLFQLQRQLESHEQIDKVTIPLSSLEATENIQFSLSFAFGAAAAK